MVEIDPDFVEYFYTELRPYVHYIPASLSNISDVARYVLNKTNEIEMKNVIRAANSWCRKRLTKKSIINDAMIQLEKYFAALDVYKEQENWHDDWSDVISTHPFKGLVEYNISLS